MIFCAGVQVLDVSDIKMQNIAHLFIAFNRGRIDKDIGTLKGLFSAIFTETWQFEKLKNSIVQNSSAVLSGKVLTCLYLG